MCDCLFFSLYLRSNLKSIIMLLSGNMSGDMRLSKLFSKLKFNYRAAGRINCFIIN